MWMFRFLDVEVIPLPGLLQDAGRVMPEWLGGSSDVWPY